MHTTANSGRKLRNIASTVLGSVALLLLAAPARAQGTPPPTWGTTGAPGAQGTQGGYGTQGAAGAPGGAAGGSPNTAAPPSPNDPREDPLTRYYFLGVRFRDIVVPQFMMEIFAKGGGTGNAWMIGPEFSTRKGSAEVDIALTYADYGFGPAMFHGKDEPDIAYEIVTSEMKVGFLTFDLLLDVPLDKGGIASFLIGGGIGIGVVAGDLRRVQAYPTPSAPGAGDGTPDGKDVRKWTRCEAPGDPEGVQQGEQYCDDGNDHYVQSNGKDYSEKNWADGGSKPVVLPWASLPQLSLRIKPVKQLQMRLDVGFSLYGFFFGAAAGYGF